MTDLRVAASSPLEALQLLRERVDYYITVHTSQCAAWKVDKHHHGALAHCTCGVGKAIKTLEAALAVPSAPVEPLPQAPVVHHCCEPSNLATAPPFARWCSLERVWDADNAAKQFDYICSVCGERIIVSVSQWRLPSAGPDEESPT